MYKSIFNFENYDGGIDEYGNVYSHRTDKIRNTCKDRLGQIGLTIGKKRVLVKHLVYTTFVSDYDSERERVVFIDGNMNNHHYLNLKLEPIKRFKLSPDAAEAIRQERNAGSKILTLAQKYNVSKTMISKIVNGERY